MPEPDCSSRYCELGSRRFAATRVVRYPGGRFRIGVSTDNIILSGKPRGATSESEQIEREREILFADGFGSTGGAGGRHAP